MQCYCLSYILHAGNKPINLCGEQTHCQVSFSHGNRNKHVMVAVWLGLGKIMLQMGCKFYTLKQVDEIFVKVLCLFYPLVNPDLHLQPAWLFSPFIPVITRTTAAPSSSVCCGRNKMFMFNNHC